MDSVPKQHRLRKWLFIGFGAFLVLGVIASLTNPGKKSAETPVTQEETIPDTLPQATPSVATQAKVQVSVTTALAEASIPSSTSPSIGSAADELDEPLGTKEEQLKELGLPAKAVPQSVADAYPNVCQDIMNDADYPGGDLVSGVVRPQGDGIEITWKQAAPVKLQPGETMIYVAYYARLVGPEEWTQGRFAFYFFAQDGSVKPEASFDIAGPLGKLSGVMDVTSDVVAEVEGSSFKVWIPGSRIWAFVGRGLDTAVLDNSAFTDGRWRLLTSLSSSTPGEPPGSDDDCGIDDSDSLHR